MNTNGSRKILEVLTVYEQAVLEEWIQEQLATASMRAHPIEESELRQQCGEFLAGLREAAQGENITDITAPEWAEVREMLAELSRTRRQQGFTPSETAMFVFSLRQPLLARLQEAYGRDLQALAQGIRTTTTLLDQLGLFTELRTRKPSGSSPGMNGASAPAEESFPLRETMPCATCATVSTWLIA